jgi:dipeptidyl aminopeptidase/acylaminoacyl peptidase
MGALRRGFVFATAVLGLAGTVLALAAATSEAAFPGANGRIAYTSNRGDASGTFGSIDDLFDIAPDGTGLRELTATALPGAMSAFDDAASYSPDGNLIAFHSSRDDPDFGDGLEYDLYVMNPDGTAIRRLTATPGDERAPRFSPDGKTLAFGRAGDIILLDLGSGATTNLSADTDVGEGAPVFFPNGERIAFNRENPETGYADVWARNLDGTDAVNLTPGSPRIDAVSDVSPDGTRLLFTRMERDFQHLWIMDADGANQTQLTSGAGREYGGVFSPDGRRIAFTYWPFEPNTVRMDVHTMNPDGTDRSNLTSDVPHFADHSPAWQPVTEATLDWRPRSPLPPSRQAKPPRRCGGLPVTLVGTPGRETLRGTPGPDVIAGLGGRDRIFGGGGNDVLCGGPGADRLGGGPGTDMCRGGGHPLDRGRSCEKNRP